MLSFFPAGKETILQFIHRLRGILHVAFEEDTCGACLDDFLKTHVTEVLVYDQQETEDNVSYPWHKGSEPRPSLFAMSTFRTLDTSSSGLNGFSMNAVPGGSIS